MMNETTSHINKTLKGIAETLADIAGSLAYIAASTDRPAGVVESVSLSESDVAAMFGALHSDGGVNFATGTSTIRTFGDPTVLSGDEEGLK